MGGKLSFLRTTATSSSLQIPLGRVPNIEKDVFISVESTVEEIKKLVEIDRVVFVRAGVDSGKTTLAQYMVNELRDEFVEVNYADTTEGWYRQLVRASGLTIEGEDLQVRTREALRYIGEEGKTIVIDDAHILFPFQEVIQLLLTETKNSNGPKILFFSSTATGHKNGIDYIMPSEIRARYIWHPPIPEGNTLVELLNKAGVRLCSDSIDFFMKLCSGRRGIFMRAMYWVKDQQQFDVEWDYRETISRVRQSLNEKRKERVNVWNTGLFKYLKKSQAVNVMSDLNNIPTEFVEMLYEGPKTKKELNGRERELADAGFLIPQQQEVGEEFEFYDWDSLQVRYTISCPIMAEFYYDVFALDYSFELIPRKRCPSSAADLLARVVPFLSFTIVVDNPIPDSEAELCSSLSSEGFPNNDNYNNAIFHVLSNILKYNVNNPLDASRKTVVVVTLDNKKTCAIESIMVSRSSRYVHLEDTGHIFDQKKTNYENIHFKALVIIGSSQEKVKESILCYGQDYFQRGLEIIGLVHAPAFDSYEMLLYGNEEKRFKKILFVCDRVAKSLKNFGNLSLISAQRLVRKRVTEDGKTPSPNNKKQRVVGITISRDDLLSPADVVPPKTYKPKFICPKDWLEDVKVAIIWGLQNSDDEDVMVDRNNDNLERIPPMGLVRCSRGGKTRALYEIANLMKDHKIESPEDDEGVVSIYVSFNDVTSLEKWEQSVLDNITEQQFISEYILREC